MLIKDFSSFSLISVYFIHGIAFFTVIDLKVSPYENCAKILIKQAPLPLETFNLIQA